jgi:hypothetical protein
MRESLGGDVTAGRLDDRLRAGMKKHIFTGSKPDWDYDMPVGDSHHEHAGA